MPSIADSELIQHPDGRVELRDYDSIRSSPLYNEDLAPVPVAKRDWSTYNYAGYGSAWRTAFPPTCSRRG
jgi:NCS1 family nucleobase:cation symporter-1